MKNQVLTRFSSFLSSTFQWTISLDEVRRSGGSRRQEEEEEGGEEEEEEAEKEEEKKKKRREKKKKKEHDSNRIFDANVMKPLYTFAMVMRKVYRKLQC